MDVVKGLENWFSDRLSGLNTYRPETVAYVTSVLARKRWDSADMSRASIVLAYQAAVTKGDFEGFQRIGDWVLFIDAIHPEHFDGVREVIESIGRSSYYSCHRILRGQWRVYEELSDTLPTLARQVRFKLL